MEQSNFASRLVVIMIVAFFAICGMILLYFTGGFVWKNFIYQKINSVIYPEATQFGSIYKLNPSEKHDLIFTISRGMQIVGNPLPGKEDFFDDIIPLDEHGKSIALDTSSKPEITFVRYKKGFMNLNMLYDSLIKERMGYKKWDYALITFFNSENNKKNSETVKVAWNKKEIEQVFGLRFAGMEERKILYNQPETSIPYHDGIIRKYDFISIQDPKIHVNFITEIIDADKVTTSSEYPKFFAVVEIYKEDDEKNQILADDQRKKEQAEQKEQEEEKQRQDELKRKQQERKAEALKQLGIQE